MTKTLEILGRAIVDIPTFYAEINRVFMADESWSLGESLDALNDLLYGGYGAIDGREPVKLIWRDMDVSRSALGLAATRTFLAEKLKRPDTFNVDRIADQLDALEQGAGQNYFDIVLEIIGDHPNIELVAA
ncbi:ribonuclease inhibitor [Sphingomonas sp. Leaf23]|uniref:barstar family protein n=1 Tax=Sphingomonas sp. Leaf23 TaxID=1735689 RepID=UPI000700DBCA|nr:ribonuclease inhibitor [Sphingomonas sp. Leaf23]KQM81781.1 ribonuclease inhibitor [Sphingomonas sp. Leaf23]